MNRPKVKPKRAPQAPQEEPALRITNPAKLPQEVKDSLAPVKGAIQQMIDRYVDDTLLYLHSTRGDKELIKRGESLKRLLKGLNGSVRNVKPEMYNYPPTPKTKR